MGDRPVGQSNGRSQKIPEVVIRIDCAEFTSRFTGVDFDVDFAVDFGKLKIETLTNVPKEKNPRLNGDGNIPRADK